LDVSLSLSEVEKHRKAFLKSLIVRGLHGVLLVTHALVVRCKCAHGGLTAAIAQAFSDATWQRFTVHFTLAHALNAGVRNVLALVSNKEKNRWLKSSN